MKKSAFVVALCALMLSVGSFASAAMVVSELDFPQDYQAWSHVSKLYTCSIRPDATLTMQIFGRIHKDIKYAETVLAARLNGALLYYQYTIGNSEGAGNTDGNFDSDRGYVPQGNKWMKFSLVMEGAPQKFNRTVGRQYERLGVTPSDFSAACTGTILDVQRFYKDLFRQAESAQ